MNPKVKTVREAIDIIANRTKTSGPVNSPEAYLARIKQNLKRDHWETAMEILTEHPDLTAEALADRIQPSNATPIRSEQRPEIPVYRADEWVPPRADEVAHQKARIDEIRESLR